MLIKLNVFYPGWWKWALAGVAGLSVLLVKVYVGGKKCKSKALMVGKTVIITGANCGLGKVTARELVKRKARVIMACRDMQKAAKTAIDIRRSTTEGELVIKKLDLASLRSIEAFAKEILADEPKIDVLINNAGVCRCPLSRTADGFEMQMGVNHLGHFHLTNLLLDKLKESSPCRVVVVSSGLCKLGKIDFDNLNSENTYSQTAAYNNSKLANNLFARELARRTMGSGISVYCLSPGMVRTQLGRHLELGMAAKLLIYPLYWLLSKTAVQGCQTILYCTLEEKLEGVSRKMYRNCKDEPWHDSSMNDEVAEQLWDVSEKLVSGKIKVQYTV